MSKRDYRPLNVKEMFDEFALVAKKTKQALDSPRDLRSGLDSMQLFYAWIITLYEESFWLMATIALNRASIQEGSSSLEIEAKKHYQPELHELKLVCDELAGGAIDVLRSTVFIRSQFLIEKFASEAHENEINNLFARHQGFRLGKRTNYKFGTFLSPKDTNILQYACVVQHIRNILEEMIPSLLVLEKYFEKYVFFEEDDSIVVPKKVLKLNEFRAGLN